MKAIRLERPGGPEALAYVEVPTPRPGPGEVLVQAHAIGVCWPEVLVRRGTYAWMPPLPAIPGIEMSGVVVERGPGVAALSVGQPVYVSARELPHRAGCYAEFIAVPEHVPYVVPEGVDLDAVAALANYQVAYHLLHSATRGFRYGSVLVQTAAGGVGSAAVQLARAAGTRVIALAGSDDKVKFALAQGADAAFNYRQGDVREGVAAATGGAGVDLILDAVAGPRFPELFDHLAPLGMVVLYGALDGPAPADLMAALRRHPGRSPALRVFSIHAFDADRDARRHATEELLQLLARGAIRPPIHARLPLADAGRAQALLESGQVLGKLLLQPRGRS
jgi:NADPH2:quinone reductase